MKKLLSLFSLVMLFALAANADGYRRTWDLRQGFSESTQAMLAADVEAGGLWNSNTVGYESKAGRKAGPAQVMVNGEAVTIPELEGITFGAASAQHLNLIINGKAPTGGAFWLNGKKNEDYFSFTVPAGEKVVFGVTTHKNGESRGVKTSSAGFADKDGNTQWTPSDGTTYQEVELINSNITEAVLKLQATNGCHIGYIIIGEGDAPSSSKVGIVYSAQNGGKSLEELAIYAALKGTDGMTLEGVNIDEANPTADQLKAYDAIILDNSLPVDNDLVAALKPNVQWQPTLNLNAPLAAAFGYGTLKTSEENTVIIDNIKKSWFAAAKNKLQTDPLEDGSGRYQIQIYEDDSTYGLDLSEGSHKLETALASLWGEDENDSVIGIGTFNYAHNVGYNEYVFFGASGSAFTDNAKTVLQSIVSELISSKSDVKQCSKPSAKGIYKEMVSKVVLSDIVKGATIYYTTDGTEPTQESPVYNGDTLTFTQEATIKAVAIADGYTLSDVMSFDVKLYHQAKAPVVTVEGGGANRPATIKLSSEDGENVKIYYNFTGANTTSASSVFPQDSAIVMKHSGTITAFAVAASNDIALVQSESTSLDVEANTSHDSYKQVAHFTGKGWNTVTNLAINGITMEKWSNTTNYFFSWGKTASASYTTSEEPMLDDDGSPVFEDDGVTPKYAVIYLDPDTTTCSTDPTWKCLSSGQVMLYQSNSLTAVVGDGNGYNPERAEDYDKDATNEDIQMGAKVSGDRYTARIESTAKYAAPFDVKVIAATTTGSAEKIAVQVSENGKDWKTIGDTCACSATKRLYKKFEASYPSGNDVFVRVAHIATGSGVSIHDIFVNQGEPAVVNPDTDGNGVINMDDVQNVLNVILTGKTVEGINADTNGDTEVNVLDLNVVINAMIK